MSRSRVFALLAAALTITTLAAGLRWGAMVAGGADSYGYVSQAGLWQSGIPIVQQDISRPSPWPFAADTWAPLGYRPSPKVRGAIVPLYAPGLPLLMALAQRLGGFCGAFVVVPFCGALTIWLTFVLGRRIFDAPGIALGGALLVATSPVFIYQLMNAMSDVPVTAAWTLSLVLALMRRPLASGLAMSVAIAIRPNLLPLAAVLGAWFAITDRVGGLAGTNDHANFAGDRARTGWLWFAAGVAPSVAGIAWLNAQLYESALTSGYGGTSDLYSFAYFGTNVRQFAAWIVDTQTPIVVLGVMYFVAPAMFRRSPIRYPRVLLGGTIAVVTGSYLLYRPFDVWWYLRFLLPTWPVLMVLTAAGVEASTRRWLRPVHAAALPVVIVLLAWHGLDTARRRSAFDLGRGERRYVDVGRFVATHTDPEAVMLSLQHSGSLRVYAGRMTLRYDLLDPAWLDRAVAYLQAAGRRPYFVLDGEEVDAFRRRFGAASHTGSLDWPPIAMLGSTVAIYDPLNQKPDTLPLAITSTRTVRGGWLCDPPYAGAPLLRTK